MIAIQVTGFTDIEKRKKVKFIVIGENILDATKKAISYKFNKTNLNRVKYISLIEIIGDEDLNTLKL